MLAGRVFDAATRSPLPGATVYLANTTVGTAAANDGTFSLGPILPGKYNLIASMVGYRRFSKLVLIDGNDLAPITISLEPQAEELRPVEVTAKRSNSRIDFIEFKKAFLGQTHNSFRCTIVNVQDIFVYREGRKLHAVARKPIEVINRALGYRIYFDLAHFTMNYDSATYLLVGTPRFENLTPETFKQQTTWQRARDQAYYGSFSHFLRSLKKNALTENHFFLTDAQDHPLSATQLFHAGNDSTLFYRGSMQVVFDAEWPEAGYPIRGRSQRSELQFSGKPIVVYANGYYHDYRDVVLQGYFGWSDRMAEEVPLGFEPSSKLK